MGEYKDVLNPFTESSNATKEKYLSILEHPYTVFKNSITKNRQFSAEVVE